MRPWLFRWTDAPLFGDVSVPAYFFMIVVGFLIATSLVIREARRNGQRVIDVLDLTLWGFGAGLVGSRLGHVFFNAPFDNTPVQTWTVDLSTWGHQLCQAMGFVHLQGANFNLGEYYLAHPHMVAAVWNGGVVFYGGVLLALPVGYWFCKRKGLDYWLAGDIAMPVLLAGLAFGRGGCLMAGCCHGKSVAGTWVESLGLTFHSSQVAGPLQGLPLHPTQLYESLAAIGIVAGLVLLTKYKKYRGQVFMWGLMLYGGWRFINELLRGDAARGVYFEDQLGFGFSTSMFIALGLIAIAATGAWWLRKQATPMFINHDEEPESDPEPEPDEPDGAPEPAPA